MAAMIFKVPPQQREHLLRALAAVKAIDEGAIARPLAAMPARIPEAIHLARLAALRSLGNRGGPSA